MALRKLPGARLEAGSKKPSRATLKAVLRTLFEHGDCCEASIETLSAEACCSESTITRSLAALVELGLLLKRERPGATTIYWFNWSAFPEPESLSEMDTHSQKLGGAL